MKFERLTEVRFEHEYFRGMFSAFVVRPSRATQKTMKNYGLEFRLSAGRFLIAYDRTQGAVARGREQLLDQNLVLLFSLELTDLTLLNYTAQLDFKFGKQNFYFSNSNIGREALHRDHFVSNKAIFDAPLRLFPDEGLASPFGKIAIKLSKGLLPGYTIRFEALATYWRYILADEQFNTMDHLSIIDKETQEPFNGPVPITLPFGKRGLSFVSPAPIKLSSRYTTSYQLLETSGNSVRKQRVLIRALQHPNPAYISRLPQEEGLEINRNYSEIII